jgi:carbamoyltransferase
MEDKNIIVGFHSGHDCSYCILEDGIPVVHEELERLTRIKEGNGDGLKLFSDRNPELANTISDFTHCHHGPGVRELGDVKVFDNMLKVASDNGGKYHEIGHHQSHAAHAYYSSKFDKALIISIDAGGWDYYGNTSVICSVTIWRGEENKLHSICLYPIGELNIGGIWHDCLKPLFDLSSGAPKGNQAGTVMAMAAIGKHAAFVREFYECFESPSYFSTLVPTIKEYINSKEDNKYNVALGLQAATELAIKSIIENYIEADDKNICFTGGVALNSVAMGKVLDWFPQLEDIFIPLVPYDGGLPIGAAQYVYHHIQNNPKVKFEDYYPAYLGINYDLETIYSDINKHSGEITTQLANDEQVVDLLLNGNIVSVFNGKSESGRRALGNRSILADPRNPNMKDLINEKVKHRQWFRPFAPSILAEETKNWFVRDIDSPYMGVVIPFKSEVKHLVPAVVHLDGTGRLQTVTSKGNPWYYNFLKIWFEKSGVPIILNTSFNDREPIVETPEDAIKCYLQTNIDYLYFAEFGILVQKQTS